jgi:osmotically-inducible protein OsmY
MNSRFALRLLMLGAGVAGLGLGADYPGTSAIASPLAEQEPDNTANNKQQNTTADQQKETAADRELAQKIRQAIVDDNSLSTSAHNVKIVVRDGVVVLRGPVQSEDETKSIAAKAEQIAGTGKVKNHLTVKS